MTSSDAIVARVQLADLLSDPEAVLRGVCGAVGGDGLVFDAAMVERPTYVLTNNQGKAVSSEHDQRRQAQVNGPLQVYRQHAWDEDAAGEEGVSEADREFLLRLAAA